MQMAPNSALAALTAIPSALGCSGWRNPLRFIRLKRASILSLFCALANPHHAGDAYMALDRVVAWATRWRESAGDPFERSVLRAYNDDEAEDRTLFMCWSILRSELMVTPRIHSDSTLIAPGMIAGTSFQVALLPIIISLVLGVIESQVVFGGPCGDVTEFLGSGVDVLRSDQQVSTIGVFDIYVGFVFRMKTGRAR